ncbi:MAG TPA: redox-sensing transcriptional repressor Rex [Treponema sp.]|nr:MAG: redox-sensing transcriptional repressor Rex [Treponema sp. GWA1_62_8]OHE67006.1 MAG: redox-sensing transcriptional repressor Rex [Treponema sp. GWC1_61_84]OHE70918.1 MAG: redox-sensing transcriptional repressor Rex [Treponema sp. RIFOXYC1_FULL_61_9]HCM27371.1 redox-sensing transcriptional repressor Rex [Treponema sp.]
MAKQKIVAAPSIRRLPSYLHIVRQAQRDGFEYISGTVIAQELNLEPIQVRKDLSITGIIGKPKKGYPIHALVAAIEHFLDWDSIRDAVLVGAGNLGSALTGYQEFHFHGLNVVAAFDRDPKKVGTTVHGVPVLSMDTIELQVRNLGVRMAILTVPFSSAQESADALVRAGITAIWNFTNVKLKVPDHVVVQKEDLSSGYAMLCVMLQSKKLESRDA